MAQTQTRNQKRPKHSALFLLSITDELTVQLEVIAFRLGLFLAVLGQEK